MFLRIFLFFLFISDVSMFQHYICKSLDLIKNHSIKYKIDESHNEIHSKEVLYYGGQLIKDYHLTETEKKILILGCLFHDVVDKKYLKENDNPQELLEEMLKEIEKDEQIIKDTTLFINNMSYSKTVHFDEHLEPYFVQPESVLHHTHNHIYHLIRNADLLSSYNLRRAFLYYYYKYPYLPFEDVLKDVIVLYFNRMKKLRSNNILDIMNKNCDILSKELEKECEVRIQSFFDYSLSSAIIHFNMLPRTSIENIISKF